MTRLHTGSCRGTDRSQNCLVKHRLPPNKRLRDSLRNEPVDQVDDASKIDCIEVSSMALNSFSDCLAERPWDSALEKLNERERDILVERRLTEEPQTLEELSQKYKVSRERVRQIEVRAFEKLQKAIRNAAIKERLASN